MATKTVQHMNQKKTQERLLAKRSELLSRLNGEPIVLERTDRVADLDDEASLMHDQFVSLRLRSNDYGQFRQIQEALARVENGTYGVCLGCEGPISPKRLQAVPWAKYCTPCEESREGPSRAA